jgi:TPR repeat protein
LGLNMSGLSRKIRSLLLSWLLVRAAAVVAAPAADQLQAAAAAGDPWAQLNLGAAYDHGLLGLPADAARAAAWYRQAAQHGLAEAQFNLAHCLATGHGVAADPATARHWMALAAAQGLADAQFLYGVMLVEGMGGDPDPSAGRSWLRRAAAQQHADAVDYLRRLAARP